ncbi:MAG: hypothetical protein ACUVWB_03405 [Anaerolineae bacterium]
MAGRGTSEVIALRGRVQILEHTVWALVERVTALEERLEAPAQMPAASTSQRPSERKERRR